MATQVSAKEVSALRARTGAGMMDCKKALIENGGDVDKAVDYLRQKGIAKAEKRVGRSAAQGVIESYVHFNSRVGVLVELNCETDFVARTDDFKALAKDLALHVASSRPIAVTVDEVPEDFILHERSIFEKQVEESGKPEAVREKMVEGKLRKFLQERVLMDQPFVKDDKKTVGQLVKEVSGKLGENVVVRRIARYELGEE
jgi:elongation factor Ts